MTALVVTIWGVVVALAVRGAWAVYQSTRPAIVAPGARQGPPKSGHEDTLDHERRLLVLEAKQRALEMEWEDTRAKFLGMTRSFIRHAKAAGLDGAGGEDTQLQLPRAEPATSSRAAVLQTWRRKNGGLNAKS